MNTALAVICSAMLFLCACTSRSTDGDSATETITPETAVPVTARPWYYLSEQGIHAVATPSEIPPRPFVPWTEAVRVTDTAVLRDGPAFLINRLGIMTPGSEYLSPVLATDPSHFSGQTAAGFVLTGTHTAVHSYRNSFFSDTATKAPDTYLVRYEPLTTAFSPLSRISNLGLPPGAQCSALDFTEDRWYGAFKIAKDNGVEFQYRTFSGMPPEQDSDPAGITSITAAEYRNAAAPRPFSSLPEQILTLLSRIPEDIALSIKLYPSQKGTTATYVRGSSDQYRSGYALCTGSSAAVLFSDGTLYIQQETIRIFKLPVLTPGYRYTGFLLSGRVLLAAWEEQRFFETGRAGILEIMLPDGVY